MRRKTFRLEGAEARESVPAGDKRLREEESRRQAHTEVAQGPCAVGTVHFSSAADVEVTRRLEHRS